MPAPWLSARRRITRRRWRLTGPSRPRHRGTARRETRPHPRRRAAGRCPPRRRPRTNRAAGHPRPRAAPSTSRATPNERPSVTPAGRRLPGAAARWRELRGRPGPDGGPRSGRPVGSPTGGRVWREARTPSGSPRPGKPTRRGSRADDVGDRVRIAGAGMVRVRCGRRRARFQAARSGGPLRVRSRCDEPQSATNWGRRAQ